MSSQFKTLLTRTISGAVFVSLVVGSFFLPFYVQFILFTLFAVLAVYEYVTIVETAGVKAHKVSCVLITVLLIMGAYFQKSIEISWVVAYICMNLVLAIELFRKEGQPFNNIVHTLMPIFWIVREQYRTLITEICLFFFKKLLLITFFRTARCSCPMKFMKICLRKTERWCRYSC